MSGIFLRLVDMSVTAGWLVVAVVLLRFALKKAPKWICCVLWALVGVRLLCPFSIESRISAIPTAKPVTSILNSAHVFDAGAAAPGTSAFSGTASHLPQSVPGGSGAGQTILSVAAWVWLAGLVLLLCYALVSFLRVRRNVRASIRIEKNVFLCDEVESPFILGVFAPKIYLPGGMREEQRAFVIAHEKAHLCRGDHLWKPLGFLLLAVYWFNPLIWAAYVLLCRDIEYACDEKVLRELGESGRADYSQTLLDCSRPRRMITVCPLAFGEVGVKERVKAALNYKKPAFWIIIAAVVVCAGVAVFFLTNLPSEKENPEQSAASDIEKVIVLGNGGSSRDGITIFAGCSGLLSENQPIWVTWQNDTSEEFTFGKEYTVERLGEDGSWIPCPMKEDVYFDLLLYGVPPHESMTVEYDLSPFDLSPFKLLKNGEYRMILNSSNGENDEFWITFSIESADAVDGPESVYTNATTSVGGVDGPRSVYAVTTAWAGDSGNSIGGLNGDKMMLSSVCHVPIIKFESVEALKRFRQLNEGKFAFSSGSGDDISFVEAVKGCDAEFFKTKTLFVVHVSWPVIPKTPYRDVVNRVYNDGENFCIYVKRPDNLGDTAMTGWWVLVAVDRSAVENCVSFDAVMENSDADAEADDTPDDAANTITVNSADDKEGASTQKIRHVKILSKDDIIELSKKGENLTWGDLEGFKHGKDIGYGMYVFVYVLNGPYELMVGGERPGRDEHPLYAYLMNRLSNQTIDIMKEDPSDILK